MLHIDWTFRIIWYHKEDDIAFINWFQQAWAPRCSWLSHFCKGQQELLPLSVFDKSISKFNLLEYPDHKIIYLIRGFNSWISFRLDHHFRGKVLKSLINNNCELILTFMRREKKQNFGYQDAARLGVMFMQSKFPDAYPSVIKGETCQRSCKCNVENLKWRLQNCTHFTLTP